MKTGVVVVTYNSGDVIERCLESCRDLPVVVVDNASTDETRHLVERHSHVRLLANSTNCGFARAVNQGVEALDTHLILVVNPDIELETSIKPLEDACSRDGVGLAGGQLVDERGQAQRGFTVRRFPTPWTLIFEVLGINRLLPPNPINRRYRCLDMDLTQSAEVDQPPGALLMFRREVWRQLGGFDTQFQPLWFEDVDFCRRARDRGLKIQYEPTVVARHRGGHSIAKLDWSSREIYWYVSLLRYASKHFPPYAYRGISVAVMLASFLRTVIGMLRWRSLRPFKVYAKVAQFAGRSLVSGRVGEPGCMGAYRIKP